MAKYLAIHCYISGKVQGVWFRATTKQQAEELGITGWVRNLADGRVEVMACGSEEQIELFYAWLEQGPPHAIVSGREREDLAWHDYTGFDIL